MKAPEPANPSDTAYLMSVKAASRWLSIPVFTLYSWAQSRKIPHYRMGKRVMFAIEDLKKWLAEHRLEAAG